MSGILVWQISGTLPAEIDQNQHYANVNGSEEGTYLRLMDVCIIQP